MVSESIVPETLPGGLPDAEKAALVAWLDEQRRHALGILKGLDEADLRRPVLPSGWSCLAMIQHLIGMERFWFRAVLSGDPAIIAGASDDGEWHVSPNVSAETIFDRYRQEAAFSNAVIAATPLDAPPAWWPEFFGDWRLNTLREIILHVLTESACHAGHLDAARELLDGRLWLVLTD